MSKEFNLEGNEAGVVSSEAVISAMSTVLNGEEKDYTSVSVLLVSDDEIQKIHKKYLGNDHATDVVTFPLHEAADPIEGEIYVSWQTTKRNSTLYANTHSNEIIRVVIHGILHLIGYDDSTPELRDEMKMKEDHYLKMVEESHTIDHE